MKSYYKVSGKCRTIMRLLAENTAHGSAGPGGGGCFVIKHYFGKILLTLSSSLEKIVYKNKIVQLKKGFI